MGSLKKKKRNRIKLETTVYSAYVKKYIILLSCEMFRDFFCVKKTSKHVLMNV